MASLSSLRKSDGIVFDFSQPSVDLTVSSEADQQRSGQIYTKGYSGALESSEYFASYQCALAAKAFSNTKTKARELLFTSTTAEKDTSAFTTTIVLRIPKLSRGSALIVVRCARLMDSADSKDPYKAQNPANQAWHYLGLKIRANATTSISRTPIENKDVKQLFHKNAVDIVESESDCDRQTPHCILEITTTQVVAQGLKIPALRSTKAQEHLANLVNIAESATATSPATFRFLVREDDAAEYQQVFQDYATQVKLEQSSDPVKQLWYKKSPNKAVLDVGTMMDILDVPDIPVQSAELVFTDKLEYMRAHGYGAKFENEFQRLYVNDYKGVTFHMKAIEMEYAKSSPDAQCETYAVIIDTAGHNVARPQFNSSLVVTMDLPVPEAQTYLAPEITLDDGVGFGNDDNSPDNAITSAHEEEMRKEAVRSTKKALPQTLTMYEDSQESMLNTPSPSSHKKERKAKKAAIAAIAKASRRLDNADSTNTPLPEASKGFPPPTSSPTKADKGKQAQAAEDIELETQEEVDAQLAPSQTDPESGNVSTDIGTVLEDASLYSADYEAREDDYMDVDPGDEVDTDNNSKDHNAWRFQVQKAPAGLLDPGQIYGFIERRREPGWTGPRKDRPFVLTDIPCSNDRWSTVTELKAAFEGATVIDVTLAPDHAEQPYKDCIRAMDAAIQGMSTQGTAIAQGILTYNDHQQALGTELSFFGNITIAQVQQQITAVQITLNEILDLSSARDWNMNAKLENMKIYQAAGILVTMRSVDRQPNAQVPLNRPIAQFPQTPDGVSQLNATECRNILTALDKPIPAIPQAANVVKHLRIAVRQAIGLPAM